ncbi:hypothetical protein LZ32DRAFT_423479 [Colletotrichum eremochloae]|nr:hypothetical protein LZ32DRAFT_423479 [Colletotrichum eremochloae]
MPLLRDYEPDVKGRRLGQSKAPKLRQKRRPTLQHRCVLPEHGKRCWEVTMRARVCTSTLHMYLNFKLYQYLCFHVCLLPLPAKRIRLPLISLLLSKTDIASHLCIVRNCYHHSFDFGPWRGKR